MKFLNHEVMVGHPFEKREGIVNLQADRAAHTRGWHADATALAVQAVDTSLVLKRDRGQHDAVLHLTGRDIEEQELALNFNAETCTWLCTGNVADRQTSQARQEILDLLREREAMTPAEIAKALEKPRNGVKSLLHKMLRDGFVANDSDGHYTIGTLSA